MGAILGELAFHLRTSTRPTGMPFMPPWIAIPLAIYVAVMSLRASGLVRLAMSGLSLALIVTSATAMTGLRSWSAWTIQSAVLCMSSILVILVLHRAKRVRLITVAAAMLLMFAFTYSTKRYAYSSWLRATKQNSVMSP